MQSSSADYVCQTIDSGAPTVDGVHVVLNATTETGSVRLMLPTRELPRIFVLMFGLLRDAQEAQNRSNNAPQSLPSFEVRELNVIEIPDPSMAFLEVILQSDAPGLMLRLSQKQLVDFATGFLQTKGLLSSGQGGTTH